MNNLDFDKKKLLESTECLYKDIDKCISDLVISRLKGYESIEGQSIHNMEKLMVSALQQFACIIDYLKND